MNLLAADRDGTGDPLLLLHGIGSSRADFASMLPHLRDEFDVLALDLPGHGQSPPVAGPLTVAVLTDAVEADLDARGLGRVHVLGNSLGGRIALELAARGRALSVVALSPSGLGLPAERAYQGLLMAAARRVSNASRPAIAPLAGTRIGRTALLAGLRARPWEANRDEALAVRGGFADARGFWSMLWFAVLLDVPTTLHRVRCPVILAQGEVDVIAAGQTARYLALVPRATFRMLPGAGHAPQSDARDAVLSLVREAARRSRVTAR